MKKAAIVLAASIVSAVCLQSAAWSSSSLLMQIVPILATLKPDPIKIIIGDDGIITAFKGKQLQSDIKVYNGHMLADRQNYEYTKITGPADLAISADGIIAYNIPSSADTSNITVSLLVKDKTTGKSYTKNVKIVIIETEVVTSGNIGPEGGQIADEWDDIVVTVPAGAVEGQTLIEVLRAIDENGYYSYTIRSSAPLLKVLQIHLPDPLLRKAPQGSAVLKSRKAFQQAKSDAKIQASTREIRNGWTSWETMTARYAEITKGYNVENRLRSDIPTEPAHETINNDTKISSELFSLCNKASYNDDCGDKDPVLFIHGFTLADVSWNHKPGLGGGEGTWGKLPELIAAEGYAVFEFAWRTNARFVDAAANLADAIHLIQEKSHKKVHIIAHSFGGLVSRAYLQNYATGRPYQDNVQSLVTLGTPHSGIFDKDGTYHGLSFKKGQDSNMFEACMQISCQQAGEPTPEAWTIEQVFGPDIDMSYWFGIDINPGKLIAKIQDTSGNHGLPVDILALMGLPRDASNITRYRTGDGLITYAGQRFNHTWANSIVQSPSYFGSGKVTEKILGVSGYDSNARPGELISQQVLSHWGSGSSAFGGYFHSTAVPSYILEDNSTAEPKVKNDDVLFGTDAPHAALTEIKAWLNPSWIAEPLTITLNMHVVDSATNRPVAGAKVYFNVNGSCVSSAETYGVTGTDGLLTKELPFYPSSKYTALVRADGYHPDEFDTGYTTSLTSAFSGKEFGTIKLRAVIPTVTSATGRIWMDRNLGASRAATSMTDTEAYGDLYQWGRGKDGHEKRTSGTTTTISSTDVPGHDKFILIDPWIAPYDWRNPQNDNLWQGVNGINNPCPDGFRLPTASEWAEEMNSWSSKDYIGAFNSPLKLIATSYRSKEIFHLHDMGLYWSSTPIYHSGHGDAKVLCFDNMNTSSFHSTAISVRCIKD